MTSRRRTVCDWMCARTVKCGLCAVFLFVIVWTELLASGACSTLAISPSSAARISRQKRASSQECGGNVTATGKRNQLTSPNYPDGYKSKQFCKWTINGDGNITLVFKVFEIEESPSCEYDNVDVLAGLPPRSLGKLCGSSRNKTIVTNSSTVTVIFKSDDSYEEKGFLMEYFTDNPQGRVADQSCHDTLTANAGNVTSPNYPLQYPDNSTCWILINVRPGNVIVMRFKEIALEFDETCSFDFVEIFDGPSEESPLLGKFCGNSQKRVLRSIGNNVLIHFRSDDLLNNRGFLLEYEADDGGIHASSEGACILKRDAKNGTITSPNYPNRYSPSSNCVVDLEAPVDARVALHFEDFSLEPDKNCSFDYVQLWDGHANGSWSSMGRLCGDKGEMKEIISTRNKMRLKFYTDNFSEFRGFLANYKLVAITNVANPQTVEDRPPDVVSTTELIDEMPHDATVAYEDSHIMKCTPKIPGAKIIWKKGDVVLNGTSPLPNLHVVSSTTIWIRKMDALLEGRYSCTVVDDDRVATGSVLLTMVTRREKPKCNIFFRKLPKDQQIAHGETAIMHCTAQVPNRPSSEVQITWLRNGLPFPKSPRYNDLGNGLVYISDSMPKDSAVYTCRATDKRSNCSIEESAILRVTPRINVEEICGVPYAGKPRMDKPHMDHGKIVGGMDSTKGAYPWQVMFWTDLRKAFCGGSLLNDQWVLTASHCFKRDDIKIDEVEVRLGKYDQTEDEPQQFVTRIADVHFHPNFNVNTFDNDIALVQLADRVTFTDFILPVCLGEDRTIERDYFSGDSKLGTVTGWGQLTETSSAIPRYLQEIRLPIVDQKTCQTNTQYPVTRNMFCAGYRQEIIGDACKGDSGGPFVVQQKDRWYVIGIVSWGVGCGRKDHYGYYVKVANYHVWIKDKIFY
ncbi:mannan-binding lectin serine protease 1-like [Ornithodoros turicata]|uniref:mannan-binding lectin serine protease 1-like n=1 Tax=Ornithodoros turicata TaxID=34597 RepID=UPI003139D5B2